MAMEFRRIRKHYYKEAYFWKRLASRGTIWIFRALFFFGLCYLFLFPVLYMLSTAFQSSESLSDPGVVWVPKAFSLQPLKDVIDLLDYWQALAMSAQITVFSTLFALVSCSLVGYGLARFRFRERGILFFLVILTIVVPPQAVMISSYTNFRFFDFGGLLRLFAPVTGFDSLNLLDTPFTFILPSAFACGLRSGLFVFIFRQFFMGIPKELEEAARIDGCGAFHTFLRIMAPMAKPAFITTCLFSVVWHWNDLYLSSMYYTSMVKPVTPQLSQLLTIMTETNTVSSLADQLSVRSYFAAGALIAVLPLLILYIILQRYFTESIEKTGIVG